MIDIHTPLPTDLKEGDVNPLLKAELVVLLFRKVNAMFGMRAVRPLVITKSDAGFLLTVDET